MTIPTGSARSLLIAWANQQDDWVRAIVGEALTTRRDIPPASLNTVKDLYLAEKQLSDEPAKGLPPLGDAIDEAMAGEALRLVSLGECQGVNALAPNQEITFNVKMTVLFGENASGKTGYVRILKSLANVRSAEPIIPDVHRPSAPSSPDALIKYTLGEMEHELKWHGETGISPLTRISVFDSRAVSLHLEEDIRYVYTPADLALFKYVHTAIEGVRGLLESELDQRRPGPNSFVTAFTRGTVMYPKIESLGAGTDLSELVKLANVTDAEHARLKSLQESLKMLTGASQDGRAETLRTRRMALGRLVEVGEALNQFSLAAFTEALANESKAREKYAAITAAAFPGEPPNSRIGSAWQSFIESGERFLEISDQGRYPSADDVCIYCRRLLDEPSVHLLTTYRDYAAGEAAQAVQTTATQTTGAASPLQSSSFSSAIAGLGDLVEGIEQGAQVDWTSRARELLATAERFQDAVTRRVPIEPTPTDDIAITIVPQLKEDLAHTGTTLKAIEGDVEQQIATRTEYQTRVAEFEARLSLAQYLPDIRSYVDRAVWVNKLSSLLGKFQGLLKSLTDTTKIASQDALNRDFERVFHDECKALRAPNVVLDFPGRRGEPARRKTVTPDHSLTAILSEGEQKVIALADFLAESSLRGVSAPVVFDDPVISLDYRRLGEIVCRVVALSAQHQVIVFTHNILMLTALLAEFEDRPGECTYYRIAADNGIKGVVTGSGHPRLDTQSNLRGRINDSLQKASAANGEEQIELVEATYDLVRAWCEVVVEMEVLGGVTQRFQPNVSMQRLRHIKADRLATIVEVIDRIFERACRFIPAHSQPPETLGVRPTVEDLRQDWTELQEALKTYKAD